MSSQNRSTLNILADTTLADNTSGDITPAEVRTIIKNLADSNLNLNNDDISALSEELLQSDVVFLISKGGVIKKFSIQNLLSVFVALNNNDATQEIDFKGSYNGKYIFSTNISTVFSYLNPVAGASYTVIVNKTIGTNITITFPVNNNINGDASVAGLVATLNSSVSGRFEINILCISLTDFEVTILQRRL